MHPATDAGAPAGRDPREWAEWLYRYHWDDLRRHAIGLMRGDGDEASELAARAIEQIALGHFRYAPSSERKALALVKAIIRNLFLDGSRRKRRFIPLVEIHESIAAEAPRPDLDVEQREAAEEVAAIMRRLTEKERQVAELHWLYEWKLEEIAAKLDIKVGTVKVHLSRARQRVRAAITNASRCPE